ncbi:MAG: hypothetical protein FJ150_01025 [Euryarchaeota archaeon]|nr:hypothetical protein [Euryarchaeota archaeon]
MQYNIKISGFRLFVGDLGNLMGQIKKISQSHPGCTIQLLNAEGVAGREHVLHAAIHALKAFERRKNIAKDLGIEICVRTSAQRQISKALDILGVREGKMNLCAVFVGCDDEILNKISSILGERDDDLLKPDKNVLRRIYKILDVEEESVVDITKIMIEKTTLLILET